MDLIEDARREMFWNMLLTRRLDERAWLLHRQGKIAFHISGIGHEAAQVAAAFAIRRGKDWVAPYYRDLALALVLGFTPQDFMLSLMGKRDDPTSGGRQMPGHWSMRAANLISHSSTAASQTSHAVGIALAIQKRKEDKVVLTTAGEGATSQGEWYESVSWAAVHKLPVVFCIENNLYALSEPPDRQMAVKSVADKACGLGLNGVSVDGTDLLAAYAAVKQAVDDARAGFGPTVVELLVYRMTPHSSDDDDRTYRTREEVEEHRRNDCLLRARNLFEKQGLILPKMVDELEAKAARLIDEAVAAAEAAPYSHGEEAAAPLYAEEVQHD